MEKKKKGMLIMDTKIKLSSLIVILVCFLPIFSGCRFSTTKDKLIVTPPELIPEDEAEIAPSFELPVIANEQEINNRKIISLYELLKEPSVKAVTLHFCLIDEMSLGWTYKELYEQNKSKGLISLMIIYSSPEDIQKLVKKTNITMPVLLDSDKAVKELYKVGSNPYIFLIDKSGKIRYSRTGYIPEFAEEFNQAIEKLLDF